MTEPIQSNDFARQQLLITDKQMLIILLAHVPVVGMLVPWGYDTYAFAIVAAMLVQ